MKIAILIRIKLLKTKEMKLILSLLPLLTLLIMSCGNSPKSTTAKTEVNIPFVQNIGVADIPSVHNSKPNVKFLDVRTPEEVAGGIINGALKIDFKSKDFKDELAKLDKDVSYIVYCKSGGRSSQAADMMQQMGFSSIYNLEGGYSAFASFE